MCICIDWCLVADYNLRVKDNTLPDLYRALWLRMHRGVLSEVAREVGVTPQMVRMVFWGQKRSRRIETRLSFHGFTVPRKNPTDNVRAA